MRLFVPKRYRLATRGFGPFRFGVMVQFTHLPAETTLHWTYEEPVAGPEATAAAETTAAETTAAEATENTES